MSNKQETLDAMKKAQASHDEAIAKAFTQSSSPVAGLTAYDLEAPSKNLYPVPTLLRNMLSRVVGGRGIQANWRSITSISNPNYFGGVGESQRGLLVNQEVKENNAAFRTLGVENSVTFEADYAARGFEDIKATTVRQGLENLMIAEEKAILFGNGSLALGTTASPIVGAAAGTIPADTYNIIVYALTAKGVNTLTVAGGLPTATTFTNVNGEAIYNKGYHAAPSAPVSLALGATGGIEILNGAEDKGVYGYAIFVGTAGNERLQAITSKRRITISSLNTTSQLQSAALQVDNSTDPLVYDGLLTQSFQNGSGSYFKNLSDATGLRTLTSDGAGGIVEIDEALASFYDNNKLSPTHLFVSSQEMQTIKRAILSQGQGVPAFRFNFDASAQNVMGGSVVMTYLNPYSQGTGVGELKIVLHPYMPAGTMLFFSDSLPYPVSNVGEVARMLLRQEYFQIEWPIRSRKYEYGVYVDGVLQHYAPFSMGVITGIVKPEEVVIAQP